MKKNYLRLLIVVALVAMSSMLMAIQIAGQLRVFDVTPNPMEEFTTITLEFSSRCAVNVFIEADNGEIIKNLYDNVVQKELILHWDRSDNMGNYVPNGIYKVVVNHQARYTSTKKTLILK